MPYFIATFLIGFCINSERGLGEMDNNSVSREEVDIMLERYSVINVKYVNTCYNIVKTVYYGKSGL